MKMDIENLQKKSKYLISLFDDVENDVTDPNGDYVLPDIDEPLDFNYTMVEHGTLTISQPSELVWHYVEIKGGFRDPIVIMGALSFNGNDATSIRVTNITRTGFEF